MRTISRTSQFKRDVKRMKKRGKAFVDLQIIVRLLAVGGELEPKYRDHALVGQYVGTRECHIQPDWLLIYELTEVELVLIRTGTHADLFE